MLRLTKLSISSILLLITCIVALPAACIIIYTGIQSRNHILQDACLASAALTKQIAAEQQNLVVGTEQLMVALSQLPEVRRKDKGKVEPILRRLLELNPMYYHLFMMDRAGVVWADAHPKSYPGLLADRRYFKNAIASGRLSSGEYVTSRITSEPIFNIAYPVKDDHGRISGVIGVAFALKNYRQLLEHAQLPAGSSFVLMDHKGTILFRALNPEPYLGKQYPESEFRKIQQGPEVSTTIKTSALSGDKRVISYQKLRLAGEQTPYMYVAVGIPVEMVTKEARRILTSNMLFLVSSLVLACACALLIGKSSITDPVKVLKDASRRLAAGDLQARVGDSGEGGELASLGKAFDTMAQELARRETEHQRMEKMLYFNEERTRQAIRVSNLGIFDHDQKSDTIYWSPRQREIHGWGPDEPVSLSDFLSLVHPDDLKDIETSVRHAHDPAGNGIWEVEHRIIRRDGSIRWLAERSQTFFEGEGDARRPVRTIGAVSDITEQKAIQEEQRQLAYIVEMSRDFIGMASLEGDVIYLNQAAMNLVGLEGRHDLNSCTIADFFPEESAGVLASLMAGLASQGHWSGEATFRHFVTHEPIAVEVTAFTLYDKEGNPIALANFSRDIRDRIAAESEKTLLTEQLIQAQKMESIGRLAGGVAHDFNNLLTPIIGYTELLKNELSDKERAPARLENILNAAGKARELVQQLLTFSRKQVLEMRTLDLNHVISGFWGILRHTIRESIDLHFHVAEEYIVIRGDKNQIEQVIMNLVINAQDAIEGHGNITIETAPLLLDDEYALLHAEVTPGRYLMLAVTDDGCGMNQETRQRIFEPFFSTKGIGKGTGLGLATVYGIVRQHGGHVWVYSEPDKGTTFKCYFPVVDSEITDVAEAAPEQVTLDGRQRTILVVEDNKMVRSLVGELLTRQGFEVLVAEGPKQALRLCEGRHLDLLVTDVVMPEMTGPELHSRLLKDYPDLKALYMSGYTNNVIVHQGVLDEDINFIQKPFSTSQFAKKVDFLLRS